MLSCVQLFATLWTVAHQAPLFSRQEHWSGLSCPIPRHLPDPGIKPKSPVAPALAGGFFFFTTEPPGKPQVKATFYYSTQSSKHDMNIYHMLGIGSNCA